MVLQTNFEVIPVGQIEFLQGSIENILHRDASGEHNLSFLQVGFDDVVSQVNFVDQRLQLVHIHHFGGLVCLVGDKLFECVILLQSPDNPWVNLGTPVAKNM
jgi:hypothetical protein